MRAEEDNSKLSRIFRHDEGTIDKIMFLGVTDICIIISLLIQRMVFIIILKDAQELLRQSFLGHYFPCV